MTGAGDPGAAEVIPGRLVGDTVVVGAGRHTMGFDVEVLGAPGDPVLLLVCGLGMQRTDWPRAFVDALVRGGHRCLLVDNRDAGLSSHVWDGASADPGAGSGPRRPAEGPGTGVGAGSGGAVGERHPPSGYGLRDMAADLVGVLDALGIDEVDVLGISMGGMIAQRLAIDAPARVRSLISIMSTTGAGDVGHTHRDVRFVLAEEEALDLDAYLDAKRRAARAIASHGPIDEDGIEVMGRIAHHRSVSPGARLRQLRAIIADGDRTDALRHVDVPTLVLHGAADRLIDPSGGRAAAAAIPGARYRELPGWGHDLPATLLDEIVAAVLDHLDVAAHRDRSARRGDGSGTP